MSSILGKRQHYESDDEPSSKRQKLMKNNNDKPRAPPNYIYKDLEVVWARLEDFPWWPAQVTFIIINLFVCYFSNNIRLFFEILYLYNFSLDFISERVYLKLQQKKKSFFLFFS